MYVLLYNLPWPENVYEHQLLSKSHNWDWNGGKLCLRGHVFLPCVYSFDNRGRIRPFSHISVGAWGAGTGQVPRCGAGTADFHVNLNHSCYFILLSKCCRFVLVAAEWNSFEEKSNRELNVCDPEMPGGKEGEDFKLFGCGETMCLSASR